MTYAEKLKDPRWQKKRLQVLEHDNFTCQWCGDKESTLHVHHFTYKGNPWEADDDSLATICEHCHFIVHEKKKLDRLDSQLIDLLLFNKFGTFFSRDSYKKNELLELLKIYDKILIDQKKKVYKLLKNG